MKAGCALVFNFSFYEKIGGDVSCNSISLKKFRCIVKLANIFRIITAAFIVCTLKFY